MKYTLCILFVSLLIASAKSQTTTDWENYTDMKPVSAMVPDSTGIWAATSGGGYFYNLQNDSIKTLHKADGLAGEQLTAVTVDNSGKVWFGSANGIIDVYNPKDKSTRSILSINKDVSIFNQIDNLNVSGDTIIVSTAFGISLINSQDLSFFSTTVRFGNFPSNIPVNNAIKSDLIYVATNSGVAIQKPGTTNLLAPESWNVYTTSQGLPSNTVNKIIFYNGKLIAATAYGLSQFNGSSWQTFIPGITNNVNDIAASGDTLYILSDSVVSKYSNGNLSNVYKSASLITLVAYSKITGLVAGGSNGLIFSKNFSSGNFVAPNCPQANQFPSMSVDNNGTLWCASGRDVTGIGFYSYNGYKWTNYNMANNKVLPSNAYFDVYTSPSNIKYLGSWGRGFIKLKDTAISKYDTSKTGMRGTQDTPDFLVISGFVADSKNNLWVLNYGSVTRKTLAVLTPDSTWYNLSVPAMGSQYLYGNFGLVIDQYDTKWFFNNSQDKPGLFYYNEMGTLNNTADDISGYLTENDGLNSNSISSVVVDNRGDVWVGTNAGVNIISNTGSVVQGNAPLFSITSVFTLREQTINCIAVDPLNNKWVGTNQGLLYVNSDGTSLLAAYNTQNSALLSDEITSITVDKNSGTVYVGTNEGLTSFKTDAIQPQEGFTKLFIYPSPFVLTSGGVNHVTIDGLIQDCNIKILTINGRLIKDFQTPGGRVAYWDGRDTNGNLVNTGVYLVMAYTPDGNNVFTGKIAVIRK